MSVRGDERLILECRSCGRCYEEWPLPAPDVACDPALADPGFLAAAATTTCPYCGHTTCRASSEDAALR